ADDTQARLLPVAFRNSTLSDGSTNNLFVAARDPNCNAGQQFADDGDVALDALTEDFFSDPIQGNFGGLPTNFSHSGSSPGSLEIVPHGSMHVAVGGQVGRSEEHTSELQSRFDLVCRLLLEKKNSVIGLDRAHTCAR